MVAVECDERRKKSDQGGIEIGKLGLPAEGAQARRNQTKVGLKCCSWRIFKAFGIEEIRPRWD